VCSAAREHLRDSRAGERRSGSGVRAARADSILGVSLFADHAPINFKTFDRSFMTFFRIAGLHFLFHPISTSAS
jgi:hypothetical protein